MGMYTNCHFTRFSIQDVGKFERRLTMWCNEECMPGKSMIIFDRPSLKVGGETILEEYNGERFYKVVLPNITLTYICLNEKMCIMHRIWENKTQSVMYNMPKEWEGTELWLGTD